MKVNVRCTTKSESINHASGLKQIKTTIRNYKSLLFVKISAGCFLKEIDQKSSIAVRRYTKQEVCNFHMTRKKHKHALFIMCMSKENDLYVHCHFVSYTLHSCFLFSFACFWEGGRGRKV